MTNRLSSQRFEQRLSDIEGAFRRLGNVDVARGTGSPQTVVISVEHPGWGARRAAHMQFVEHGVLSRGSWEMTKYAYDLFLDPAPGRFGFHGEDGDSHTHCVDPAYPGTNHHFAGSWIDIFDAFGRFTQILMSGAPLTCTGLAALRH